VACPYPQLWLLQMLLLSRGALSAQLLLQDSVEARENGL
jgi:hypothetical protein